MGQINLSDEDLACICSGQTSSHAVQQAQETLVERWLGRWYGLIRSKEVPEEDAQDILIDAAAKIMLALSRQQFTSRGPGSFQAWAFAIVCNEVASWGRKQHREAAIRVKHENDDTSSEEGRLASKEDPHWVEDTVITRDDQRRAADLLYALPLKAMEKRMVPFFLDGTEPRFISERTGIPAADVSRLMYRLRQKAITEYGGPDQVRSRFNS